MIWKNRKIRLLSLFALPVLSCLFCLFGCSSKSSAFGWVYNQNINAIPFFTTYVDGTLHYYTNYDSNVPNPWTALYANQSGTIQDYVYGGKWNMYPLYGGNVDYLSYNILEVYLHVNGTAVDGAMPYAKLYAGNSDGTWNPSDDCAVVSSNGTGFDIRCIARYSDNIPPQAFDIELLPYQNISTGPSNWTIPNISNYYGPITIEIDYRILSYPDPNMALLAEQNGILLDFQNGVTSALEQQISQDQLDRDNISGVSSQATQDGNNASVGANNASSPILGAITGIYSTLLNPHYTNCNIGPLNIYGQLNLGTIDMCALDTPPPIVGIGSLVCIGLILLLAWSVLHAGMSLYKELFGGGK